MTTPYLIRQSCNVMHNVRTAPKLCASCLSSSSKRPANVTTQAQTNKPNGTNQRKSASFFFFVNQGGTTVPPNQPTVQCFGSFDSCGCCCALFLSLFSRCCSSPSLAPPPSLPALLSPLLFKERGNIFLSPLLNPRSPLALLLSSSSPLTPPPQRGNPSTDQQKLSIPLPSFYKDGCAYV